MSPQLCKGIELLADVTGQGTEAIAKSRVRYAARFFLHRGDEVTLDKELIAKNTGYLVTRVIEGTELVLHQITLGKRQAIAGVEKALVGMNAGGFREVVVAPQLAYGDKGVLGRIPKNALLRIQLWLVEVEAQPT